MLKLRFLEPKDETAFFEALAEDWQGFTFAHYYSPDLSFAQYLRRIEAKRVGTSVANEEAPTTLLFAFVRGPDGKDRCVGHASIRHRLNESLSRIGGHIGYGVRPSDRRKGYATEILGQALLIARAIGIERALLTCDDGNLGSIRAIERNGGALESILQDADLTAPTRRYWITLA